MNLLELLQLVRTEWASVTAHPEAFIAAVVIGLTFGWGAAWVILRQRLIHHRELVEHYKDMVAKEGSVAGTPESERLTKQAPKIEIRFQPDARYETSQIVNQRVLSTVRIGVRNAGGGALSNCKVYIEKISPEPALPGGLPILLEGAGFIVRHDDPEKLVDIAALWDHTDKFRFAAPFSSAFSNSLGYIDLNVRRTITVKVDATECQRGATFRISADDSKILHLEYIGYVN